jgi:outer membrane protein TolC
MADVGASRAMDDPTHATYTVAGVVRVPLWEGGRIEGRVQQAASAVSLRRIQLDDLRAQIEADVRRAYVDIGAADGQVGVARETLQVRRDDLAYAQQQAASGLAESIAVAHAKEAVAAAELDYADSVFAHNLAKLGLARALGRAAGDLAQFLLMP